MASLKYLFTEMLWQLYFKDLGRMYNLTSRVPDALGMLKQLLEEHIYSQGLSTIEKCGEAAINVCIIWKKKKWIKTAFQWPNDKIMVHVYFYSMFKPLSLFPKNKVYDRTKSWLKHLKKNYFTLIKFFQLFD